MRVLALRVASVACVLFAAREAHAEECFHTRPTDPGGSNGYDYGAAEVRHFDGARTRVFYATSGVHAPDLTSVRSDNVPDSVSLVATVTDDALTRYEAMGYRMPISDGTYDACASNGGDARFDVYLVRFGGADGVTVPEACRAVGGATRCAGYIMADATFSRSGYANYAEGVRTVLPHETFHAIQNAYDAELDRAWAEGTAQWATKTLDPSLMDLERFLPAFFADNSRSLDVPASGVTASYLYGAAIWPVFLTQRHGASIVLRALEIEGDLGGPSVSAVGEALKTLGENPSTLEAELPLFAAWNASTGKRAGKGGYANAAAYPMAKVLPLEAEASGLTTGYGWYAYSITPAAPDERFDVSIDTDGTRNSARLVPLVDGVADLDHVAALPASNVGASLVVVAGISSKKSDARFVLKSMPHVEPTPEAGIPSDAGADSADIALEAEEGGCTIGVARAPHRRSSPASAALAFGALMMIASRARGGLRLRRRR